MGRGVPAGVGLIRACKSLTNCSTHKQKEEKIIHVSFSLGNKVRGPESIEKERMKHNS